MAQAGHKQHCPRGAAVPRCCCASFWDLATSGTQHWHPWLWDLGSLPALATVLLCWPCFSSGRRAAEAAAFHKGDFPLLCSIFLCKAPSQGQDLNLSVNHGVFEAPPAAV